MVREKFMVVEYFQNISDFTLYTILISLRIGRNLIKFIINNSFINNTIPKKFTENFKSFWKLIIINLKIKASSLIRNRALKKSLIIKKGFLKNRINKIDARFHNGFFNQMCNTLQTFLILIRSNQNSQCSSTLDTIRIRNQ